MRVVLVAAGGAIGAIARYLIGLAMTGMSPSFPFATLLVNLSGCFLIGVVSAWFEARGAEDETLRIFLAVGVLGGFTTFSAFGNETFALMRNDRNLVAFANVSLHLFVGLAAVWLGRAMVSGFGLAR